MFNKKYTNQDFSVNSYHTLNLIDNDIQVTANISSYSPESSDINQKRFRLLNSVVNSKTSSTRSRTAVKQSTPALVSGGSY